MASRQVGRKVGVGTVQCRTYRARVKIDTLEVYLGTYKTRTEAENAEDEYRRMRDGEQFATGVYSAYARRVMRV